MEYKNLYKLIYLQNRLTAKDHTYGYQRGKQGWGQGG